MDALPDEVVRKAAQQLEATVELEWNQQAS